MGCAAIGYEKGVAAIGCEKGVIELREAHKMEGTIRKLQLVKGQDTNTSSQIVDTDTNEILYYLNLRWNIYCSKRFRKRFHIIR